MKKSLTAKDAPLRAVLAMATTIRSEAQNQAPTPLGLLHLHRRMTIAALIYNPTASSPVLFPHPY